MSHHEIHYDERIREQGYRLTPQRQVILEELRKSRAHPTAVELFELVSRWRWPRA